MRQRRITKRPRMTSHATNCWLIRMRYHGKRTIRRHGGRSEQGHVGLPDGIGERRRAECSGHAGGGRTGPGEDHTSEGFSPISLTWPEQVAISQSQADAAIYLVALLLAVLLESISHIHNVLRML
jgi:hypothetical protein